MRALKEPKLSSAEMRRLSSLGEPKLPFLLSRGQPIIPLTRFNQQINLLENTQGCLLAKAVHFLSLKSASMLCAEASLSWPRLGRGVAAQTPTLYKDQPSSLEKGSLRSFTKV